MVTAAGIKTMFHTDKMGSVVAMSNATNGQLATNGGPFAYDSYGNCFVGGTPCSAAGAPYLYTGQRFDPETGLYYYKARYYSAPLGRFMQVDPVGYAVDVNDYIYGGNSPANNADPSGMAPNSCGGEGTSECPSGTGTSGPSQSFQSNSCSRVGASDCGGNYEGDNGTYDYVHAIIDASAIAAAVVAYAHEDGNQSSGGCNEYCGGASIIDVAYNGKFHDVVRDYIADAFRHAGVPVETEMPLSTIESKVTAYADVLAAGPRLQLIEVKTGKDPGFTPNQRYVYEMAGVPEHVFSADARIINLGYPVGEPLPAMDVTVATQRDASSPLVLQPLSPIIQ